MRRPAHLVLVAAASLGACAADAQVAAQVQVELNSSLTPGDSHQQIEAVLTAKKIGFTYDKYANRYQGIIRNESSYFRAVVVYVRVDADRRFLSAEAHDTYTAP
jgi:hypothetical protein